MHQDSTWLLGQWKRLMAFIYSIFVIGRMIPLLLLWVLPSVYFMSHFEDRSSINYISFGDVTCNDYFIKCHLLIRCIDHSFTLPHQQCIGHHQPSVCWTKMILANNHFCQSLKFGALHGNVMSCPPSLFHSPLWRCLCSFWKKSSLLLPLSLPSHLSLPLSSYHFLAVLRDGAFVLCAQCHVDPLL